jgi:hypothetical protein
MAKEKDRSVAKEERRALRKAEKEGKPSKRSDEDGVHKSKSKDEKEEKKRRRKQEKKESMREVGVGIQVEAEKVVNGGGDAPEEDDEMKDADAAGENDQLEGSKEKKGDEEGGKKDKMTREQRMRARPVGALVPFANPLADDKVAKKVFKGVKKGESYHIRATIQIPQNQPILTIHQK